MYHSREITGEGAFTLGEKGVKFGTSEQDYGEVVEEKHEDDCQADVSHIAAQEVCNVEGKEREVEMNGNRCQERTEPALAKAHALVGHISAKNSGGNSTGLAVLLLIFGLLLLILALRNLFGEEDPDAPPSKILALLDKLGPLKLFGMGIGLSLLQPRFVFQVLAGAALLAEATLSASTNIASLSVLALLMIWPMLLPILLYAVMGKRCDAAMKVMRRWLTDHQRQVNVGVMGVFGVLLLVWGLTGIA